MSRRPPLRVTGFTRFLVVMIIVAPLAYLAASYYNGEDGIQNIKNLLGIDKAAENGNAAPDNTGDTKSLDLETLRSVNQNLQQELDRKTRLVDELSKENQELRRQLESLQRTGNKPR